MLRSLAYLMTVGRQGLAGRLAGGGDGVSRRSEHPPKLNVIEGGVLPSASQYRWALCAWKLAKTKGNCSMQMRSVF
jgi:hypothetical protein